ncbi:hypothetical protein C1645_823666 [Glomus cerebriforme]|uniref:Uncharacterized protein n=1 Tax=Glomus cerebriforme TaxID=658196 RepID=A0A397SVE0_9GLOM|nr:hypothetical protein C1645_823666 [Glomus cerebriforme]
MQNIGLMRNEMDEDLENLMKKCNSIEEIHTHSKNELQLKDGLINSLQEPINLMKEIEDLLNIDDRTKKDIKNKPIRSDELDFSQVHSLPDPIPVTDKTSYKQFSDVYDTIQYVCGDSFEALANSRTEMENIEQSGFDNGNENSEYDDDGEIFKKVKVNDGLCEKVPEDGGNESDKITKAYKEETKNKRRLVREKYYEEFFTEFWKEQAICQLNVGMTTSYNISERLQPLRIPDPKAYSGSGTDLRSRTASEVRISTKILKAVPLPNISHSIIPAMSRPPDDQE